MPSHHVVLSDVTPPQEGSKHSRLRRLSIHHAAAEMDVITPPLHLSKTKITISTYIIRIAMDVIAPNLLTPTPALKQSNTATMNVITPRPRMQAKRKTRHT